MLTIHVGLPKTGSTAIQRYLSDLGYSKSRHLKYRGDGRLLGVRGFQAKRGETESIIRLLNRHRNVVLSSEYFLGPLISVFEEAEELCTGMTSAFHDECDFQIVIYLRPQHSWAESAYFQWVRYGRHSTPVSFAQRLLGSRYIRFSRLIRVMRDVAGTHRVIVRPYPDNSDVVRDFISVVDPDLPSPKTPRNRVNAAGNVPQALIATALIGSGARELVEELMDLPRDAPYIPIQVEQPSIFPSDIQRELLQVARSDWIELAGFLDPEAPEGRPFNEVVSTIGQTSVRPDYGISSLEDFGEFEKVNLQLMCQALTKLHRMRNSRIGKSMSLAKGIQSASRSGSGLELMRVVRNSIKSRLTHGYLPLRQFPIPNEETTVEPQ